MSIFDMNYLKCSNSFAVDCMLISPFACEIRLTCNLHQVTVGSEIIRVKKLISNAVLQKKNFKP